MDEAKRDSERKGDFSYVILGAEGCSEIGLDNTEDAPSWIRHATEDEHRDAKLAYELLHVTPRWEDLFIDGIKRPYWLVRIEREGCPPHIWERAITKLRMVRLED